jgi:hypothetical protein
MDGRRTGRVGCFLLPCTPSNSCVGISYSLSSHCLTHWSDVSLAPYYLFELHFIPKRDHLVDIYVHVRESTMKENGILA